MTKTMRTIEGPKVMALARPIAEFFLSRRLAKDLKRIAQRLETG